MVKHLATTIEEQYYCKSLSNVTIKINVTTSESYRKLIRELKQGSDWGTLVQRSNVKNVMKLGFLLEKIYFVHYNSSFIETLLYVQYIIY
jgi:hypothetical protein